MRAVALLLLTACAFPTPQQQQRSYAESLRPAEVKPAAAAPDVPIRKLRVRVYADRDYQQQTPRWNARIEQQIERASAVLEPTFGVRLEVESMRPWERTAGSDRLDDALNELGTLDAGAGIDWVVGFVSSTRAFTAAQEDLGRACLFCRHFVLRGMSSASESDAIDQAFTMLSTAEREALARERRVHRETALFLHEWAHTLGAFHERSPRSFMGPLYDTNDSGFSPSSARIIGLGLEYRDVPASRPEWSKAYRAEVERSSATAWDAATRDSALSAADYLLATTGARPKPKLPDADDAVLQRASALESAEDYDRAESALKPLVQKYPYDLEVQTLACRLAQKRGARIDAVVNACRPAARLPDAPPHLLLTTAHALLSQGARTEAVPLLTRAEQKLGQHPEGWLYLAQLDFEAGACAAAERAAAHAKGQRGAERVGEECARMRHLVGYPPDAAALPTERESEYVSGALAAHRSIEDRKLDQARAAAALLRRAFPGTPAAGVIECRAASRGAALLPMKQVCAAVAGQAPDAFYPQYTLGLIASAERRWQDANAALERAVQLDDSAAPVWQSLAAVKQKMGDAAGLRDLQQRFLARFKATLRPLLWPAGWKAR
jgi:predicted Zn-dependent protease